MNGIDEHTSDVECVLHSGVIWKLREDSVVEEDIQIQNVFRAKSTPDFHFTFLENQ
jgi:hypothetical protein